VSEVGEVGSQEHGVDAVGESSAETRELETSQLGSERRRRIILTVRPVNSLRMGRIRPSHSVNSSSRDRSNRFLSLAPRSRPRIRSEMTRPAMPVRLIPVSHFLNRS
jgi:hypothetical protein